MKPQRSRNGRTPDPGPRPSSRNSKPSRPGSGPSRGDRPRAERDRDSSAAQFPRPQRRTNAGNNELGGFNATGDAGTQDRRPTRAARTPRTPRPPRGPAEPRRPHQNGPNRARNDSTDAESFYGVKRRASSGRPAPAGPSRTNSASPQPSIRPRKSKPSTKLQLGPGKQRLQRLLADAGIASRRECERLIEEGHVEVNGEIVTRMPVLVDPRRDRVRIDGQHVRLIDPRRELVYVMLHKPERVLCTTRDATPTEEGGRRTVLDLLDQDLGARIYPVGRLDYHATGIVLLTNDGDLTNRLTHARYGVTQTYRVWAAGKVTRETLDMLRRRVGSREAVDESGIPTGGVRVDITPGTELDSGDVSNSTVLEITVREGKRESIADMLLACGCPVKKMVRVAIGPLRMKGVGSGRWRKLTPDEVGLLQDAAYSRDAADTGAPAGPSAKGEREGA